MENFIDNLLENIFGGVSTQLNIIAGIVLIAIGIFIFAVALKKQSLKGKKIAAWICIGIGCVGVMSGIAQMIFR